LLARCPGSKALTEPYPESRTCACGEDLEIWTDEMKVVCPQCGVTSWRDPETSCLQWCDKARECVGGEVYDSFQRILRRKTP